MFDYECAITIQYDDCATYLACNINVDGTDEDCTDSFYDSEFWWQLSAEQWWVDNMDQYGDFWNYWNDWHSTDQTCTQCD